MEVSLEPAHSVTGEQVLYRARILRRGDVTAVHFTAPIAFPDVRTAWLPGRAEDAKLERDGATYLVREEHRALFPARAGHHALPAFRLRCDLAGGTAVEIPVPAVSLAVVDPPEAGRPPGYRGLIGPLNAHVLAEPGEVTLGEAVRLSVLILGAGNLFEIEAPFGDDAFGNAEVFRRPTELEDEPGERLQQRRFFRMDVVPHVAGPLQVPGLALPYYDPSAQRYAIARTEPLVIHVRETRAHATERSASRVDGAGGGDAGSNAAGGAEVGAESRPAAASRWLLATVAALALGAAGIAYRRATHRLTRQRWRPVEAALADAAEAARLRDFRREAAELARALRIALELASPPCDSPQHTQAHAALAALEVTRFAREATRADRDSIEQSIGELRA